MFWWLGLLPSAVLLQQVSVGDSDQAWSSLKGCFIFIIYGICELLLQVSEAVIIISVYSSKGMFLGSKCLCQEALPLCFLRKVGVGASRQKLWRGFGFPRHWLPVSNQCRCFLLWAGVDLSTGTSESRVHFSSTILFKQNIHETLDKEDSCYQRFRQMQRELALIVRKQLSPFDSEVTLKLRNAAEKTLSERSLWD